MGKLCDAWAVMLTQTSRLHQRHEVILENGVASAQPGTPIQVRLCNVGTTERSLKTGSVGGYSTVYEGPVIAIVEEMPKQLPDKAPPRIAEVNLDDAPKNLHTRIRTM